MAKSYEELKNEISAITNEVEDGANTANRIGGAMADIADFAKESLEAQEERINEETDIKISGLVVQETGDGEKVVMSQKAVSGKFIEFESEVNGFKLDIKNSATTVKSNTQLILGDLYNLSNLANSQVRVRTLDASGNVVETLGYIPENTTRTIVAKTSHASLEFYCSVGVNVVIESQKGLAKTIEIRIRHKIAN